MEENRSFILIIKFMIYKKALRKNGKHAKRKQQVLYHKIDFQCY